MPEVTVVGSGLDALICSASLLDLRVGHELLVDSRRLGGHFAGWMPRCGAHVDMGMVALEEDTRGTIEQFSLGSYQGQVGVAARPYLRSAFDRLRELGFSFSPLLVGVSSGGQVGPDYFISDDLSFLAELCRSADRLGLPDFSTVAMRQLESDIRSKAEPQSPLMEKSLVSVLNDTWGRELSDYLFGGLLRELDPQGVVNASDHRQVWIPLYWPSTIARVLDTGQGIDKASFLASRRGPLARDIAIVAERVLASIRVSDVSQSEIFTTDGKQQNSSLDGKSHVLVDFRLERRHVPSTTIHIVHFCTEAGRNETLFLRERIEGLFRVNWRSGDEGSDVCHEFGM